MAVRRLERTDESSKLLTIEAPIILRLGLVIQARCLLVHVEFHKVKKMIKRIKYMKYAGKFETRLYELASFQIYF